MQTWICQLLFPVVDPTTSATVVDDLFQLTHDTTLAGLRTDLCHSYGPVADNGNKKAWMELLVELKKAANQQGFSLVANGGHKGTTHCLFALSPWYSCCCCQKKPKLWNGGGTNIFK
jgi:hypothetical protein